jgi:hypothetical protein
LKIVYLFIHCIVCSCDEDKVKDMPIEIAQEDLQEQEIGLLATVMEKIDAKVQGIFENIPAQ